MGIVPKTGENTGRPHELSWTFPALKPREKEPEGRSWNIKNKQEGDKLTIRFWGKKVKRNSTQVTKCCPEGGFLRISGEKQ